MKSNIIQRNLLFNREHKLMTARRNLTIEAVFAFLWMQNQIDTAQLSQKPTQQSKMLETQMLVAFLRRAPSFFFIYSPHPSILKFLRIHPVSFQFLKFTTSPKIYSETHSKATTNTDVVSVCAFIYF